MLRETIKLQIVGFVKQWMAENKGLEAEALDIKEHMFQAGYLDSLGLFRLIVDVEAEFGVELDQDQLFCSGATDIDSLSEVMSQCVLFQSD